MGKWSVVDWSVVGGSVVGGFDKTREMHTELFLNQHTFMMN